MWLLFALLSPFFWAVVHVLDRHCVERVFARPWMGVITSGLSSVVILLAVPFAFGFTRWDLPAAEVIALALCAGALIQLSQAFYFEALEHSEAGIVAAYWNMVPALLPVASFAVLGGVLAGWHYVGIVVLVLASVCFCLLDTSLKGRRRSLLLMASASTIQVIAILIEKYVFERATFFVGFLMVTTGIIAGGSAPLIAPGVRRAFLNNMANLRPAIPLIIGIEIANLAALFMSQQAIALGTPSLVTAVEATVPAYTFALGLILVATTRRFGDAEVRHRLPLKLTLVIAMVCGVYLVS